MAWSHQLLSLTMEFHHHLSVQDGLVEGDNIHILQLPIFLTHKLGSSSSMHVHDFAGRHLLLRYVAQLLLLHLGPLLRRDRVLPRHPRL